MLKGAVPLLALSIACAGLTPAGAQGAADQAPPPGGRREAVYDAAFFAQFSPTNALQMIQRTPGFSLESGDTEVRGFGQAAGNVVINGQRPSSKSDTLDTVLARIPASRVLRIELSPGARFGTEYSSKAQVADVILSGAGGVAGTIEGKVRREFTGALVPQGSASALLKRGPSTFNVALGLDNYTTSEEGYDRVVDLPAGTLREYRIKTNRIKDPEGHASVSWALDEGPNRTAHLNASLQIGKFRLDQSNHVIPTGDVERDDRLSQRYFGRTVELGGDITRPLAGGGIKLVVLGTRRFRDRDDVSLIGTGVNAQGGFFQNQRDRREESVARLSWSRPNWGGWSLEIGGEGAYNRLASVVTLDQADAMGQLSRIDLPLDDAVVEEVRGEAFANLGRKLTGNLHLDLGFTMEASRLTVSGDASARRSLSFPKPKATLDWRAGAWHVQFSAQRTVAQLNFEDFISVAELTNDRVNGGNAELLPQRAWEFNLTADRKLLGDGRIKVELGYNRIEKVQDRIPTPEGFDAPGNLGTGTQIIARTNLDLPLGRLGIKGGRFSLYGSYVGTDVRDPYTLMGRPFSGNSAFYGTANFRQDLGKFAWGLGAEVGTKSTSFRLDELDTFYNVVPYLTAFAEYRPTTKTTITVGLDNLTNGYGARSRYFFAPDRTNPLPFANEFRLRNSHVSPYISIKHSFG